MSVIEGAFWISTALLLIANGVAWVNIWTAPRLSLPSRHFPAPPANPSKVSVLIPARNEAHHLNETLTAWFKTEYPLWELIVLDDHSTDSTPTLLAEWAQQYPQKITVVNGLPLPAGWRGKNWACHQLSQMATGSILLFVDADVSPAPSAVNETVRALQKENAHALCAFGFQEKNHWASQAVLPLIMEIPILGFIPLRPALYFSTTSLTAAVGQWFAFQRYVYDLSGGHAAVPHEIIEDMALGRRLKSQGFRLASCMAPQSLRVRMYGDFSGIWNGFAKNLASLGGRGALGILAPLGMITFIYGLPFIFPWIFGWQGFGPLLLLLSLRSLSCWQWRQSPLSILWHIPGTFLLILILMRSAITPLRPVAWKGRNLCKTVATP